LTVWSDIDILKDCVDGNKVLYFNMSDTHQNTAIQSI